MVPFAGWEMPVQYSSIIEEHMAVREKAGLFDVSHMGELHVHGNDAGSFLERLCCNHVRTMEKSQVRYNAIPNEAGGLWDDVTIYRKSDDYFIVVSNASNYERVFAHLQEEQARAAAAVQLEDHSDETHLLAIQGPLAQSILEAALSQNMSPVKYYRFAEVPFESENIIVSRTGYTGEDGFEIYSSNQAGVALWDLLLKKGGPQGLLPAGLGARDSLRLEAFYPLYGHELSEEWTPSQSGLAWIAKVKEPEFHYPGYDRIIEHKEQGGPGSVCALVMGPGGVPREGYPILDAPEGTQVGTVLSGGYSPILKAGMASAYLPAELAHTGTELAIQVRNRGIPARVTATPLVKGGAGAK